MEKKKKFCYHHSNHLILEDGIIVKNCKRKPKTKGLYFKTLKQISMFYAMLCWWTFKSPKLFF